VWCRIEFLGIVAVRATTCSQNASMLRARPDGHRDASRGATRVAIALFLISFTIYSLTISRTLWTTDVFGANWTSWHIARTGSPWIDGTRIPDVGSRSSHLLAIVTTHHGHTAFGRFPGVVAASIPAYVMTGSRSFSTVPGSLTAAFLTSSALVLMFHALRRYLTNPQALLATVVFGFATPVWTVSANLMWPQTITVLAIAGMAWSAASDRWWWAGVFGGIGLWGRAHVAIVVAVLGLGVAWRRRTWVPAVRVAIASGVLLATNCMWIRWMYGTWNPLGAYDGDRLGRNADRYRFDLVNQLGAWVAPDRGILIWTPVILLLMPAMWRSWRDLPDWSRSLLVGGLVYTVVGSALDTFTGGEGFFGYRYGLEFLACATPAVALSSVRMGKVARAGLGPVIGVQLFAYTVGALEDQAYLPQTAAWQENAFVHAVALVGPLAWLAPAVAALLGFVVAQRFTWFRTPPTADAALDPDGHNARSLQVSAGS